MGLWTKTELYQFCKNITKEKGPAATIIYLMDLRRSLQEAATIYKKTHGFDAIQLNVMTYCELISKGCSKFYKRWAERELLKRNPALITRKRTLKDLVNQSWERQVQQRSY